ncbi:MULTISPECIES: sensor histidine kinase [unclassified Microbacterium]|uniref:sensor histidine kinase n=1 Tax=unclassified Microbacterium TaxID=2609290 RepID=UPI001603327F|nr:MULTISPECIES: histidine kinase [unclassified Microbacterium]MBT2484434.1 sensor histidine kinase [Microbacterium sp. ISL-108]
MGTATVRLRPTTGRQALPRLRESVVVAVLIVAAIVEGSLRDDLSWPAATVVLTVVMLSGLLWRRSHPLAVVLIVTALTAALDVAQFAAGVPGDGMATMFALILAPYSLFRWGARNARVIGGVALAAGVLSSAALGPEPAGDGVIGALAGVLFVGCACLLGALRRERAERRQKEIAVARSQEREALARDLHDTIGHHVSAIAIRAQATAFAVDDPSVVADSLRVIETEAKTVLDEMRSLVRTLRTAAEYAPATGLSDLARLATVGPPRVTVEIEQMDAPSELHAATLYRVAQEAVTNARRHADAVTEVSITLRAEGEDLDLRVRDDGRGPATAASEGYGLVGIAERVALLGGTVDAGRQPEGGWLVHARIPRRAP